MEELRKIALELADAYKGEQLNAVYDNVSVLLQDKCVKAIEKEYLENVKRINDCVSEPEAK